MLVPNYYLRELGLHLRFMGNHAHMGDMTPLIRQRYIFGNCALSRLQFLNAQNSASLASEAVSNSSLIQVDNEWCSEGWSFVSGMIYPAKVCEDLSAQVKSIVM